MKIVIGIILVAILMAALIIYLVLVMNSHDLAFCGDIPQTDGTNMSVTRIYTADFNANETLSEIVNRMNANESGNMSAEELTEILATYQSIAYAPVFLFNLSQEDDNTFVLTGSVYNGRNGDGEPETTEFSYRNLTLTAGVPDGKMLAVQNVYSDDFNEDGQPSFKERKKVVDPVLMDGDQAAAFAFRECDSFRIVFTSIEGIPASITLAFTYEVVAQNPLDFTNFSDGAMGVTITANYDDRGELVPELEMERVYAVVED
ncbi:MAG: hypothetical protein NC299_07700 [Lachnospiraceae bacterium]|nr:hypothetical protein [Ruminococcus sp.]MCM1275238.1 hypothetical protein [Lachnospiraceae bacterium]